LSIADIIAYFFLSFNISSDYNKKINEISRRNDEDIKRIVSSPFFPKDAFLLLSKDYKDGSASSTIIKVSMNVSLLNDKKMALQEEEKLKNLISGYEHIQAFVIGSRIIEKEIMDATLASLRPLVILSIIMVIVVVWLIYRDIYDTFISLLSIFFSIIWVYGFASLIGYYLNPVTISIPVILFGMGIDYSLYLRNGIREEKEKGKELWFAKNVSLRKNFLPIFLSAITTSVAFLSNIFSRIPILIQFGILTSLGIISCLINSIIFSSLYRCKKGIKSKVIFFPKIYNLSGRKKFIVIISILSITVLMAAYSLKIEAKFDMKSFLPEKIDISRKTNYLLSEFEVSDLEEVNVLIRTDLKDAQNIVEIMDIIENINDNPYIIKIGGESKISSIFSLMRDYANSSYGLYFDSNFSELYNKFFENDILKKNLSDEISSLYDYLYSISPEASKFLNKDYSATVIRIYTNTGKKEKNIEMLYNELAKDLKGKGIITGNIIVGFMVLKEIRNSQLSSLFFTIISSLILVEIFFCIRKKSYFLGFVSMFPVFISVLWIMGTMSIFNINLTITTATVASLAVGLGIDYSIHITYKIIDRGKDGLIKITNTLIGAMLTTIFAFSLLSLSLLPPLKTFGILIAISISYTFWLCILILPILLSFDRARRIKEKD
jgi:predicted RND superfamily exporter protein